jgi:hypothetical protein
MLAGAYNFTIEQGATFTRLIEIEYPDPDDLTVFLPFDLTGYSASMQIRRTIDSADPQITLTDSNGRIEIQSASVANAIRINLLPEETALLETDGVYDIEIEDASGAVSRILKGTVTLSRQVTR